MKKSPGWILLMLVVWAAAALGQERPRNRVDWLDRFPVAMEEAAITRRPVLLTFYTDWCGWCRKLERTTFVDERFTRLSGDVVPVRVNGDKERGLASMFRVTGYPTTVILSRRGQEIGRIAGYKPADSFVEALQLSLEKREPLDEVIELVRGNPDDPEAIYALGDVLLALGQLEPARAAFGRVLDLETSSATLFAEDAQLDTAISVLFEHDYRGAVPAFREYLKDHPQGGRRDEGLFFCGVALLKNGEMAEGLEMIDRAAGMTESEYIRFEVARLKAAMEGEKEGG